MRAKKSMSYFVLCIYFLLHILSLKVAGVSCAALFVFTTDLYNLYNMSRQIVSKFEMLYQYQNALLVTSTYEPNKDNMTEFLTSL